MYVVDQGRIRSMAVPEGWEPAQEIDDRYVLRELAAVAEPKATLSFYWHNKALPPSVGEELAAVLDKPPHDLTAEELSEINLILRNQADAEYFELTDIRTEDLAGKRVLAVEGLWKESGNRSYGFILPDSEDGLYVQEVYFCAPQEVYEEYAGAALQAFASIDWKQSWDENVDDYLGPDDEGTEPGGNPLYSERGAG